MSSNKTSQRLERLLQIGAALPEAEIVVAGEHRGFQVGRKKFAWYQNNHHGDGLIALVVKASFGDQDFLITHDPEHFFKPGYLGSKGWVGLRLDQAAVDWEQVKQLLATGYCLTAPKRLAALVKA